MEEPPENTRFIDARISLQWLIGSAIAVVISYAGLAFAVSSMSKSIEELKQDRATWLAQNQSVLSELRSLTATDAVQSNRLDTIERELHQMQRISKIAP